MTSIGIVHTFSIVRKKDAAARAEAQLRGVEVKKAREQLGMSLSEFAQVVGVNRMTVWRWEDGRVMAPDLTLALVQAMVRSGGKATVLEMKARLLEGLVKGRGRERRG